ncbi:TonB-dependent receptor [Ancylomarina euxinus]|uniref:TonB-dependent receptor n=1 Tax=Ancylomarina euxinus TaxID=2283627 RepID=A0A425XYC0_9BACT|nr:TonB-dependent receptor [Ancylomarina euxinus]MCZ4695815.1 TonB-dependent receptor [Ancylomarina euxinus]MUP16122.1 TonB-dependent receptor [Ancylomarina euxinus]RRG19843.1 TonB-dependent receptor [Ancylomarina euxinus]
MKNTIVCLFSLSIFKCLRFILIALLILSFNNLSHAQSHNVYGIIKEKETGEVIPYATVFIKGTQNGCVSNAYGFYSLRLPSTNCKLVCSFVGFKNFEKDINSHENLNFDIFLVVKQTEINEVKVVAESQVNNILTSLPGQQSLQTNYVKSMPSLAGESDVLKSIQLLPGVQSANEGSTNLHVRGGNFDQNLFLLDEAPVYNPSHALGFFSVFNTDAIRNIDFYKSIFPAKYGGRLSSVIDIKMKEGNSQTLSGSGSLGIAAAKVCLEGPVLKGKGSFLISGRYSYLGALVNAFSDSGIFGASDPNIKNGSLSDNDINFYDYNLKMNYNLNTKNRLYWSLYSGSDHFYSGAINSENQMDWGNRTSTLRWNHIYNTKLFSNTSLIYSKYNYEYVLLENSLNFTWSSSINQLGLKSDYDYILNSKHRLNFGLEINRHIYHPGKIEPRNSLSNTKSLELQKRNTADYSIYLEDKLKITDKFLLNAGLRYTLFTNLGKADINTYNPGTDKVISVKNYKAGEIINTYSGIEPRVAVDYLLNDKTSIKFSYNKTKQYVHLISNSSAGLPTDVWLPSSKNLKPQTSEQYSFGIYKKIWGKQLEVSAEVYYKNIRDVVDYKDNANLFVNEHIETQLLRGKAKAKGFEFYLKKNSGRFQGWLSYTLADVKQKVMGVSNSEWYNAKYNVRHNLALVALFNLDDRFSLSSNFKFKSGGYVTIPQGFYTYQGSSFPYYTERNGFKLDNFHQLDFSLSYKSRKNKTRRLKSEWILSAFNIYSRANIFSFYATVDRGEVKAFKMYLYRMVPSLTYKIKF